MSEISEGWDEYREGMTFGWRFGYSPEDMSLFASLSKDMNPIHVDPDFAKAKGYDGPLVYGLLLASQTSCLIGEKLPDKNAILTEVCMKFSKPAFVSEDLWFGAQLVNKSDSAFALSFKCEILRSETVLCRGTVSAIWRP